MVRKRFLPKYVSSFLDRHKKERFRFRKAGKSYYFKSCLGTEEFRGEYRKCLNSINRAQSKQVVRQQPKHKSIDDLITRYFQSGDFKLEAQTITLSKNRAILNKFRKQYGALPSDKITFSALDKIITNARIKQSDGSGGNFAAQKLRKELKRLFKYAVKLGWLSSNPVDHIAAIKTKSDGFHCWTETEIKQYQSHWKLGTKQRLAMEIMLWTAKRVGHVTKLGKQHIVDGFLETRDPKTGKFNQIAISADLKKAIEAMEHEYPYFIPTAHGKGYSEKGLSQAFSRWCQQANLVDCSAHGLRKAISRRMSETGITNREMKSITQHSGDAELEVYTRSANQKKLAQKTINALSKTYITNKYV